MKASNHYLNLGLVVLLSSLLGCTTTGRQNAGQQSVSNLPNPHTHSTDRDSQLRSTSANNQASQTSTSPIQTVGYQADGLVERDYLTSPEPQASVANEVGGMTLEDLEQLALGNNPSIQQASAAVSKAVGIRTQVGLKPNPKVGYFGEEIGNDSAGGLHGAFVSQMLVRGEKLAWNRQVIGHDVASARWQVEAQRFRVRNDIRIQFYEALGAQRRLEIARQFRSVAKKGVEISEELVRVKEGAKPDILQSEVQLSEADLAIQQAEYEFNAAWNELAAIAGMPELSPAPLIGDLETPATERDIENAYAQLVAESPLVSAACAKVRRAQANLQRQRAQPISNVTAQIGAGYDDGTGDEFANVQISLPLSIHNKNQGNIRAAHAEYCAATQNVKRLKMQLRRNLAKVMRSYQVAKATVGQYETAILPKVGETLELMQEAQEAGEFDFLRVLTARRAYFDANLKYVVALTDLAKADTRIDGLLLTGGLDQVVSYGGTDELRGAALSGQ